MNFIRKIYINNKPLILTNSADYYIMHNPVASGYMLAKGAFKRNFRILQQHLKAWGSIGAIIEDISVNTLHNCLFEVYEPMEAAGGVVCNDNQEILMIYRRGKWDLPKGKKEDGESNEQCAIREVMEETGLEQIELDRKIHTTYHVYSHNMKEVLKTTCWYMMKVKGKPLLMPQEEENILEAKWISIKELEYYLGQTYEGIKEVVRKAEF